MLQIRLSKTKKNKLDMLLAQANQHFANEDYAACERACRKIERIVPGLPNVSNLRGSMAAAQGKLEEAVKWFSRALQAAPEHCDFMRNLARVHALMGEPGKAIPLYKHSFHRLAKEGNLKAQLDCCVWLADLGDTRGAIELLTPLQQEHPENVDVLAALASAHMYASEFDAARKTIDQLLQCAPTHPVGNRLKGKLAAQEGKLGEAEHCFRLAMEEGGGIEPYSDLVQVKTFRDKDDPDITGLRRAYRNSASNPEARENICFALGKVFDDLGDYDQAFSYFAEGNRLRRRRSPYLEERELTHIQHVIEAYQPETLARVSRLSSDVPIFIVSMPRSGSTLTEQIIASHPDVDSRGECNAFECVAIASQHDDRRPLTLERIRRFSPEEWEKVGKAYLNHVCPGDNYRHITDKSLTNIRMIGAIHCALPHAKIIHVRRHPLDTCLSIFKKNLDGDVFCYGTDLRALGHYYQGYRRLMAHWRSLLPEGSMLEVDYESIVRNQERETRRMLDFCGLPWNDACLRFHQRRSQVSTASVVQVRKPIYQDSLAAWQRYENHLQPLIEILGTEGWPPAHET